MRHAPRSVLFTLVVPALLAVPVAGPVPAVAHPVTATLTATALAGVDASALAESAVAPVPVAAGATPGKAIASSVAPPAVLTAKRSTKRFDLVALTWRRGTADAGSVVRVRVRENGAWTAWQPLETDDDAPDAGTPESSPASGVREGTVPLLTGGADGVQVRVDTPTGAAPAGLTLDLVDGGRSAADAGATGRGAPRAAAVAATQATQRPGIITRAQWGADERLVKAGPVVNSKVKTLVVHHTDTANSYSAAQSLAQIRSVLAFHTKGRGWNDIGYNFIVDRYGRVFEGRRGSLGAPVMGAHTMGFNSVSLGVSVLGSFSAAAPPQAAQNGVVGVLAWLAAQYQISPRATASVVSSGGSASRYKAGTTARVPGITGHRDLGLTECPGNAFYPRLPWIRSAVAARMVPGLTDPALTGSPAPYGTGTVTFSATIPTRQTWTMAVTPLCGGTPVRTLSGTSSGRITSTWDLRDSSGQPVAPGAYTVSVTTRSPVAAGPDWQQDVEVLPSPSSLFPAREPAATPSQGASPAPSSPAARCPVERAAAEDPALTSVVAGRLAHPDARTVVLVNASGGPAAIGEALGIAPLAIAQGAPLLLTGATELPDVVARDIAARQATTAWIAGSAASITPAVEQQLRGLGVTTVTRVSGADKWATAAAIAERAGAPDHAAVLVSGEPGDVLDALVAAGSAAGAGRPVLLTARGGVPAPTLAALRALKVTSVTVVGSEVTVPEQTLNVLASAGVTRRTRLVGNSRWATAAAIANAFASLMPRDRVVLTSGFVAGPDLLLASAQGRPVLLSGTGVLPATTATWLSARPALGVTVLAAPTVVATPVLRAVQNTRG